MNNFINWIAINNTLMIRVGFTAILALLIIYFFRYFFLPKINMVEDSLAKGGDKDNKGKAGTSFDEDDLEKRKAVEQKQAQYYTAEIEKSLIEIAKLKDQLMDANTMLTDLKEKNQNLMLQTATSDGAVQEQPAVEGGGPADADYIVGLKSKVESLEARLSEYEIIAEDISEIGQLRKENTELRKKLGTDTPVDVAEPLGEDLLVVDESLPESENGDILLQTEPAVQQGETVTVEPEQAAVTELVEQSLEAPVTAIKIVSEKEVSTSDRDLIDHFEETTNKKGP